MRKENILIVVLVGIAIVAGGVFLNKDQPDIQAPHKIEWTNFSKGFALAKEQNKNIFLYFHADWCTFCKKMDETTFRENDVVQFLNSNFISITVDTDVEKMIANSYGVKGLPTIWFLKPDGTKNSNIPGYVDEKKMMKILDYIHSSKYEKMSFQDFVRIL
jgi:thioredoxin-related protein